LKFDFALTAAAVLLLALAGPDQAEALALARFTPSASIAGHDMYAFGALPGTDATAWATPPKATTFAAAAGGPSTGLFGGPPAAEPAARSPAEAAVAAQADEAGEAPAVPDTAAYGLLALGLVAVGWRRRHALAQAQ
jgi:hypothetical protein